MAFVVALACMSVATVAAAVVGDGRVPVALTPMAVAIGLWIVWTAPLPNTLLVLIFLGLSLDKSTDTQGLWQSPLAGLGTLLIENLNKTVDVPWLKIPLLVILLACLLLVRIHGSFSGRVIREGSLEPAPPLQWALAASFLTAMAMCVYGLARGGDGQMGKIQLQVFVQLVLLAYLLATSLRGSSDYWTLANIIIVAGCVKAGFALWVRYTVPLPFGEQAGALPYATSHGDSILFACAFATVVASYLDRPAHQRRRYFALALVAIVAGVAANDRRIAWIEIAASVLLLIALNLRNREVRTLLRRAICAVPLVLVYAAAGWTSTAEVFKPVAIVRSMVDSNNRSTFYRDAENYDLLATFRENPVLGTGFGQPFNTPLQLDALPDFKEWRYLPHNSILGLWAFVGAAGFTGLWCVFVVGLMLAVRSHGRARSREDRVAASLAMASIVAYTIHCWGDIGFSESKSIFLVGAGLAIAGQLAASTGAWPSRRGASPA